MLEIFSNSVSLDLPDDIQINFIIENPLIQADRIPVPFTLDFDLSPSAKNLMVFNYPNRVTSFNQKEFAVSIKFEGVLISSGLLKLKSYDVNLKVNFKGVGLFDELTQKLYSVEMEKCDFGVATQVKEGKGKWGINRLDPNNFAGKYKNFHNDAQNNTKFALAPLRIPNTDWERVTKTVVLPGPLPGINLPIPVDIILPPNTADNDYINFYNFRDKDFNITSNFNLTQLPELYSSQIFSTRAFPFPYIGYVFDVCFKNTLTQNPFANGELAKIAIVCPYHPNWKEINGFFEDDEFEGMLFDNSDNRTGSFAPYYKLNSFLPDMAANQFLKEVMKLFCMSLFPDGDRFKIVRNEEILQNPKTENWTNKKIGKLKFNVKEGLAYKYGYDIEDVKVTTDKSVNTINGLIDVAVSAESNFIADFKVVSTGEYYTKEIVEGNPLFTRLNTGYGKSPETNKTEFDSTSLLSPLPMMITTYWTAKNPTPNNVPGTEFCYMPEYTGDRTTRPTTAKIMFDRGIKPARINGDTYPLLTACNYDHNGNRVGDYSLAWDGEDGLINKFHKSFKEWTERDKMQASGEFRLTPMDFKNLDLSLRKYIDGRRFFVEKISISFGKNKMQSAIIDFIED